MQGEFEWRTFMSKRSQIEEHLQKLNEIGDIMRAMKNVSLMEVHKLARFLDDQQRVLAGIEAATTDFVRHYAGSLRTMEAATTTYVVALGSERGFCGDFNDAVLAALQNFIGRGASKVVAVGSHLTTRLADQYTGIRRFAGPSTVEEVPAAIEMLMRELADSRPEAADAAPLAIAVLCHQDGRDDVVAHRVSALPEDRAGGRVEPYPPLLNEPAAAVHSSLLRHHLWARMHLLFYSSLLAEHRFRLQHMESALRRMDEKITGLRRRQNILRQEEITEEIEVIMLNSDVTHSRRRREGGGAWR